jgi:hypothetical protein
MLDNIDKFINWYIELGKALKGLGIDLCMVSPLNYDEHIYHDKMPSGLVYGFQVNNGTLHEYDIEIFKKKTSKGIRINMTQIEQIHYGLKQIRLALHDLYGIHLEAYPVEEWIPVIRGLR